MLYIILESHPAYYAYIIIYPKIFSSEAARIQLAMHRRTSYSYDDALHSILFFPFIYILSLGPLYIKSSSQLILKWHIRSRIFMPISKLGSASLWSDFNVEKSFEIIVNCIHADFVILKNG